jgi:hypothetical protein
VPKDCSGRRIGASIQDIMGKEEAEKQIIPLKRKP